MIRPFSPIDDYDFYSMAQEFYSSAAVLHSVPEKNFHKTFEQIMQNSPYLKGYIIESADGALAGYSLISLTWSNEVGGMTVWLEEAYILPEYRRQGLGSELFKFIREEFPDAKRFRLEVTFSNLRAIQLYERLGFSKLEYIQMIKDF